MTPRERNLSDIGLIALRHGVTRRDVLGGCRSKNTAAARRQCYVMFREKGLSLPAIGRIMGRHHTSVLNGLKKEGAL